MSLPPLVRALLDGLAEHPEARNELRRALALEHPPHEPAERAAYTAATLATELGITARAVRAAIARGDLDATKHGGRWIIARQAIEEWARPAAARNVRNASRRDGSIRARRPMADALADLEPPDGRRAGGPRSGGVDSCSHRQSAPARLQPPGAWPRESQTP